MSENKYRLWCEKYGLEWLRRASFISESEEEIASRCDIAASLLRSWRKKYPEFDEAIRLGKSESDYFVIKALHKKATGFNVGVKKTYKLKRVEFDPDTGKKLREYEELATGVDETYIPPDLSAEKFWLKNRQGESWLESADKTAENTDEESGILELPAADMIDSADKD